MTAGEFAWGEPDADGIALGLTVQSTGSDGCSYRIALANRTEAPRAIVLFATLDDTIRTRLVARQGDAVDARPAVLPAVPVSSNIRIAIELAPGQIIERPGVPAKFALTGDAVVQLVVGGVKARPDELRSGEISVRL
jgi:hypothetical protein